MRRTKDRMRVLTKTKTIKRKLKWFKINFYNNPTTYTGSYLPMQKSIRQVKLLYTQSQRSQSVSKPTLGGLTLIIGEHSVQTILSPPVVPLVGNTDKMVLVKVAWQVQNQVYASAWNFFRIKHLHLGHPFVTGHGHPTPLYLQQIQCSCQQWR